MNSSASESLESFQKITLRRYATAVGLFALLLIASTWKLWIPGDTFPQIPLFGWGCHVPKWVDYYLLTGMLIALCGVVATGWFRNWQQGHRYCWVLFALCMVGAMILNQHRIQTWAYQFFIVAVLYAVMKPQQKLFWLKWFAISIYFYSAISKLDFSFIHQQGGWLVDGLTSSIGLSSKHWSPEKIQRVALLLPLSELLVAILLCIKPLGKWRLLPAVAMHLLLLLTFSPWGHIQNNGVLLWNCFFIAQVVILFGAKEPQPFVVPPTSTGNTLMHQGGVIFILLAMTFPLLERTGYYDTWTSWSVYAGHPEQVVIEIDSTTLEKLPDETRFRFYGRGSLNLIAGYSRIRIDRWALRSVGAPIYPESRFRVGVALFLAERYHLKGNIRLRYRSTADRFTGKRSEQIYHGMTEIKAFANEFILNTEPRLR